MAAVSLGKSGGARKSGVPKPEPSEFWNGYCRRDVVLKMENKEDVNCMEVLGSHKPEGDACPPEMKIAPSMLSCDFARIGEELIRMEKAGADYIHLDVMDGCFVPNITIGPSVIRAMRPYTKIPFDVHLMIRDPLRYVENFAQAGADMISFHVEAESDVEETIRSIRRLGVSPGLVLKPATPVSVVLPYLPMVDMVLVMTVEPGFGGQKFMVPMLEKVRELKKISREKSLFLRVEIDGGVNEETVCQAAKAGVDICVAGTGVFRHPDVGEAIRTLKENARQALL